MTLKDVSVTARLEGLQRGAQLSRIVDRALQGLPGGERAVAAAHACSKSLVHHWRDDDNPAQVPARELLVDGPFARAALCGLAALHKGLVIVDVGLDKAGGNAAARLGNMFKESSEHHLRWTALLARHGGDVSKLTDAELAEMVRESREDLEVTARALSFLCVEQARRDTADNVTPIGEAG